MAQEQRVPRISLGIVAGLATAVLAAGGGAWWAFTSHQSPTIAPAATTSEPSPQPSQEVPPHHAITPITPPPVVSSTVVQPSPPPSTVQQAAVEKAAEVYWLKNAGNHMELVPTPVAAKTSTKPTVALEEAFNNLLAGPTDTSLTSTIPQGTKLYSVKVENDGIHINLSQQFTTGGGSTSMMGRVAQILYTATSIKPDAKVWLAVEGKPLEVLGGEGLELDQPITRQSFKSNFSL